MKKEWKKQMKLIQITVDKKRLDITLEFLLNFFAKTTATKSEIIELLHLYNFMCMELRLIEMVDDNENNITHSHPKYLNKYQKEYCKNQKKISQENIKKIKKEFTNKFSNIYFRDKINDTLDKILKEVNDKIDGESR